MARTKPAEPLAERLMAARLRASQELEEACEKTLDPRERAETKPNE